ncbi:MAG: adenylyl-sulfate kinase [Verrucomicrobiota bacterium]
METDQSLAAKLKVVIVGHVDHGKSTLIGRLLHDTESLPDGKVEQVQAACKEEGMEFEFAFLLDALLEEQEQNITIDTTQIPFKTDQREFVIIDAPGHKEFLKNMITGAAHADAALLLIDANEGVQEQSRRHGYLLSMLGVSQVIVVVNKMDLIGYSEETYRNIRLEYTAFLEKLGVEVQQFVPISAKLGEGITKHSEHMGWYQGPTILDALNSFTPPTPKTELPLRLMVQDVYRFDARRIIAGRIEAGRLKTGDEIVFWPDRKRSVIKSIEAWNTDPAPTEAAAGESVAITLEEQIFVERGQLGAHVIDGPAEAREFKANIFWLAHEPLVTGELYNLKVGTQSVEARLVNIHRVMDSSTLDDTTAESPEKIDRNEVAEVTLRAKRPLALDNVDRITETGRFVIMMGTRIGGGGIIHDVEYAGAPGQAVKSSNISWSANEISREERVAHFGHRGGVIWLTGLSGSGKSTLAVALESFLFKRGIAAFILDGDNLRHGLCADLGFSADDRRENIRRASEAAKLLAESGMVVITALISPFTEDRDHSAEICHNAGIPFAEVYVSTPLEICEQRDPKQLYARARAGEIKGFTGIDSPYEPPTEPELELPTHEKSLETCLQELSAMALKLTAPEEAEKA